MAINLRASVRREINRLRREIARAGSRLASLKGELRRGQRISLLLGGEKPRKRRVRRRRSRKRAIVDWNAVLKRLPSPFGIDQMAKRSAVKRKPRAYLRQVVVRWAKEGKIKRTGRGRYRKV